VCAFFHLLRFPKPGTPAFQLVYGSAPKGGNTSLLLFYAYVKPLWSGKQRADVIEFTHDILSKNGCTGRLRVALEGFNSTLTGPPQGIRNFCDALREFDPVNFGKTDFKIVDGMADNKAFRNLKVFPVTELVTYGIPDIAEIEAKIENGGIHVKPDEWTRLAAQPNTVMIDVRNANESGIVFLSIVPSRVIFLF
jgi:predicted sulfurtransferase